MTREEQRAKAAHEYIQSDSVAAGNEILAFGDFINGAKWADFHSQWIPVEERRPPIAYHDNLSENHLVVDSDGELLIAYYDAKHELWFSVDSNPRIYDVTHWMPLPEAPMKGGDNEND